MVLPFRAGLKYRLCWLDSPSGEEQHIEEVVAAFETVGSDVWAVLENGNAYNLHFLDAIITFPSEPGAEPEPPRDIVKGPIDWDYNFTDDLDKYHITDLDSRVKALGYCEKKAGRVQAKLLTGTALSPVWYPIKDVKIVLFYSYEQNIPAVLAETETGDKWFPWFKIVATRLMRTRVKTDGAGD